MNNFDADFDTIRKQRLWEYVTIVLQAGSLLGAVLLTGRFRIFFAFVAAILALRLMTMRKVHENVCPKCGADWSHLIAAGLNGCTACNYRVGSNTKETKEH